MNSEDWPALQWIGRLRAISFLAIGAQESFIKQGIESKPQRTSVVPNEFTTRTWEYSLYFRDQWQISRKLTVNYGLRWEYFPMPTRGDRGLERYDFDANKMLVCGTGAVPTDCGVSKTKLGLSLARPSHHHVHDVAWC